MHSRQQLYMITLMIPAEMDGSFVLKYHFLAMLFHGFCLDKKNVTEYLVQFSKHNN